MNINDRYERIINIICNYKGIEKQELINVLRFKNYKYMLFLFLKKYKCDNLDKITLDFNIKDKRIIKSGYKKAKQKVFINKEFRDMYFEIEDIIEKNIR